ncbi:inward rectifier potassium channel irk-1-like isoform X1 [Euwallacea fornicatus]|uniref:inward rectifier potassium channel irk-1-like isoform X1 n=1 Tax=Euwallacea fornicatus TaxID=995702 RepID=UPI00338E131A
MTSEKDILQKFLETEKRKIDFPVVLRTHSSIRRNNLRRNTPLNNSQHRRCYSRIVSKRGRVQVYFKKIPQKSLQYAKNLWNTLVDMQWKWLSLTVTMVNVLAYLSCGVLFYLDAWISGDFEKGADSTECIVGIQNLWNFFMLGIETITTTGYGYIHPTESCDLYFIVLTYSTLIGILIDGAFISVVYAKMNRAKESGAPGNIFSKKAVIALRNGKLCLIMRVNDMFGKHGISTEVRMYLIKYPVELEQSSITELEIQPFGMLFWPVELIHEIGPSSPLWTVSARALMTEQLEIVVVVSGSSIKTGQSTRSQTSYINTEIMWGYNFVPCLDYNHDTKEFTVNKKLFQQTVTQEVPLCSANKFEELHQQMRNFHRQTSLDQEKNRGKLAKKQRDGVIFYNEV